jgi:hypothetical protein
MKTIAQTNGRSPGEIGANPYTPDHKWYLVVQQERGFLTTICFDPETRKFYPQEIADENFAPLEVPEDIVKLFKGYAIASASDWSKIANKLGGEPKK